MKKIFEANSKHSLAKGLFHKTINMTSAIVLLLTSAIPLSLIGTGVAHAAGAPAVSTGGATNIARTSATLHGSVTDANGSDVTQRGFEYGIGTNYSNTMGVPSYSYVSRFGSTGSGDGQFNSLYGIAVDSSGNIYVADQGNYRIQKFDSNGNYISQFGSQGAGNGQFGNPMDIAIDSQDNIYVLDLNNRIQKFDSNGNYISQFGSQGAGNGNGQFNNPQGIAIDSQGNILVADTMNNRIQKFDSNGTYLSQFGSYGAGNGQFDHPTDITIDSSGNIYVSDRENSRIEKFSSNGTYISQWGSNGSGNGQFNNAQSVAMSPYGTVFVVDSYNHRVQEFTTDGSFISTWGTSGSDNGQMQSPEYMAIDSSGNIFIAERDGNRVDKFAPIDNVNVGSFSTSLSDDNNDALLTCGTTYHYRAYAANAAGTSYGDDQTFTTAACPQAFDMTLSGYRQSPEVVKSGDDVRYKLTVKNQGPGFLSGPDNENIGMFYVNIPANTEFVSAQASDGFVGGDPMCQNMGDIQALAGEGIDVSDYTGSILLCQVGSVDDLNSGDSYNLTLDLKATADFTKGQDTLRALLAPFNDLESDIDKWVDVVGGTAPLYRTDYNNVTNLVYGVNDEKPAEPVSPPTPNTVSLANPVTNTSSQISLTTPEGTTITCSNSLTESQATAQDGDYSYPLGLVDFCFDGASTNNKVTLAFVTNLKPSDVVARKYNSADKSYFDIPNAKITEASISGHHVLILTYTVTDNGKLDLDKRVGKIKDPVGLAVKAQDVNELADTGMNVALLMALATGVIVLSATALLTLRKKPRILL